MALGRSSTLSVSTLVLIGCSFFVLAKLVRLTMGKDDSPRPQIIPLSAETDLEEFNDESLHIVNPDVTLLNNRNQMDFAALRSSNMSGPALVEYLRQHSQWKEARFRSRETFERLVADNPDIPLPRNWSVPLSQLCTQYPDLCSRQGEIDSELRANERVKLGSCIVPKTSTSALGVALCSMLHSTPGRPLQTLEYTYCGKHDPKYYARWVAEMEQIEPDLSDWTFIQVTREPLDRFISGFLNLAVMKGIDFHGCGLSVRCYLRTLLHRFQVLVPQKATKFDLNDDDYHFSPQTWHCRGRYSDGSPLPIVRIPFSDSDTIDKSFWPAIYEQFRKHNVSEELSAQVHDQLATTPTSHTTISSPARVFIEDYIRSRPYLLELVVRIYHADYTELGHSMEYSGTQ